MDFSWWLFVLTIFGGIGGIFAILTFLFQLFLEWPRFESRIQESIGAFIGATMFLWFSESRALFIEGMYSSDINMIIGTLLGTLPVVIVGAFMGSTVQNFVTSLFEENEFV